MITELGYTFEKGKMWLLCHDFNGRAIYLNSVMVKPGDEQWWQQFYSGVVANKDANGNTVLTKPTKN